ncbi:hypothetical protein [Frankia sp. CcWB2]
MDLAVAATTDDPVAVVGLALEHGIAVTEAAAAAACLGRVPEADRPVLAPLGGLLARIPVAVLVTLASLDLEPAVRRALAGVEQAHPGAVDVVALHGAPAAPIITGPRSQAMISLLQRIEPTPGLVPWILTAGPEAAVAVATAGPGVIDVAARAADAWRRGDVAGPLAAIKAAWEATGPTDRVWPVPAAGVSRRGDNLIRLAITVYPLAARGRSVSEILSILAR